ncbi:MAG TPA: IscS subfamily cysteine desulfurase [Gemmataceae bacterium]|nr:IscS subfamily cysteine desulfurase [Gemmataceae bacterium]
MVKVPIYLDNHATTRVDPRVVEAMLPFFTETYGNAGSRNHVFGWKAAEAVDQAREQVAHLIGASPKEIVFTSGATESNNLALKGTAGISRHKGKHIVTSKIEHKAVIDPCKRLERDGIQVTFLDVDHDGIVSVEHVGAAIKPETILVSIMSANNEIGTLQPIREVGKLCKERGVLFHCDAAQAVGKIPIDVEDLGVDLLSLSGHKIYGPKGVGALYVRRRNPVVRLDPQIDGGGQERGLRSGTLAVSSIVALGKACELCQAEMEKEANRLLVLRNRLQAGIMSQLDQVYLNGHPTKRLPGNLNLSFAYVEGEALMVGMKNVAVSSGSACTSANLEPSYVLKALGVNDELARSSIRFGLGRFNTEEEVDYAIEEVVKAVTHLRNMSPLYEMARNQAEKETQTSLTR